MAEVLQIEHLASLDKIPSYLQDLPNAAIGWYDRVFNDAVESVYALGSWVRGQVKKGSDADFCAIINRPIENHESDALHHIHEPSLYPWVPTYLTSVDLKAIDLSNPFAPDTIQRKTIILVDGCLVHGQEQDFTDILSLTIPTIASAFLQRFVSITNYRQKIPEMNNFSDQQSALRQMAKFALRTFEWVAVNRGAALSSNLERYLGDIARFCPDNLGQAENLWTAYLHPDADCAQAPNVVTSWIRALTVARDEGFDVPTSQYEQSEVIPLTNEPHQQAA